MSKANIREKLGHEKKYREHLEGVLRKVQEYLSSRPTTYHDSEDPQGTCTSCGRSFDCDSDCRYNTIKKLVDETLK